MPGSLASRISGPYGPDNPPPPPPGPPPKGPKGNKQNHKQTPKQDANAQDAPKPKKKKGSAARCSKSVKLKRSKKLAEHYGGLSEDTLRDKYVPIGEQRTSAQREGRFHEVDWDGEDGEESVEQAHTAAGYNENDPYQQKHDGTVLQSTEVGGYDSHQAAPTRDSHSWGVEDEVDWGDDDDDNDAGIHALPPPAAPSQLQYSQAPRTDYSQFHRSEYSQAPQAAFGRDRSPTPTAQNAHASQHRSHKQHPLPSRPSSQYSQAQKHGRTDKAHDRDDTTANHTPKRPRLNSYGQGSEHQRDDHRGVQSEHQRQGYRNRHSEQHGSANRNYQFARQGPGYRSNHVEQHGSGYSDSHFDHQGRDVHQSRDKYQGREKHPLQDHGGIQSNQGQDQDARPPYSRGRLPLPEFGSSNRYQSYSGQADPQKKQVRSTPDKVNCPKTVYDLRDYDKQVTALHRGLPHNERFLNGNGKVAPWMYGSVQGYDLGLCFSTFATRFACEMGPRCAWRHHPLSKAEKDWIVATKSERPTKFAYGDYWCTPKEPVPGANMYDKQNGMLQGSVLR